MKNTISRKIICLLLTTAQCLAPVFAQTTATITPVETIPALSTSDTLENQTLQTKTQPQDAPVSPTSVLSPLVLTTTSETNQSSTTATLGSTVIAPMSVPAATTLRVLVQKNTMTAEGQRYPDEVLRVVERSHTGAAIGLVVVGLFLGAGFLPPSKENNRGTKISAYPHPLFPGLAQSVSQWAALNKPDNKFKNPLLIRPDMFLLVYSDLSDDKTNFELQAYATITRKPDSGGWFTAHERVSCSSNFNNEKMPLEQWQANEYAEIKKRMTTYSQECITTVIAALPKLLKD